MNACFLLRFTVLFMALAASPHSLADEAFFSADGKTVTFIPIAATGRLRRVELASGRLETLMLGSSLAQTEITSICRGGDGETLFTTAAGVYVLDPKGARKLSDAPVKTDWPMDSLTAAPSTAPEVPDWLFVSSAGKNEPDSRIFYSRKPGTKAFKSVFCRRVRFVGGGVFTPDGRFFFVSSGDLWEGGFTPMDGNEATDVTLVGTRIAPLAIMNTDDANAGNLSVAQVMPAGKALYVRLHGTHMSELLRLTMPAAGSLEGKVGASASVANNLHFMHDMLGKAEVIDTGADEIYISAATEINGQEQVFYRARGDQGEMTLFLWEKATGKSRKIAVEKDE